MNIATGARKTSAESQNNPTLSRARIPSRLYADQVNSPHPMSVRGGTQLEMVIANDRNNPMVGMNPMAMEMTKSRSLISRIDWAKLFGMIVCQ